MVCACKVNKQKLPMKRIREEEKKRPVKKLAKLIRAGLVLFLIIFFVEIWAVNRLATYGDKIQELKNTEASLELENQILENAVAQKSSLYSIGEKASKLGFDSAKSFSYLNSPSLASARSL